MHPQTGARLWDFPVHRTHGLLAGGRRRSGSARPVTRWVARSAPSTGRAIRCRAKCGAQGNARAASLWSTPVHHAGYLYGMISFKQYGDGPLKCLDLHLATCDGNNRFRSGQRHPRRTTSDRTKRRRPPVLVEANRRHTGRKAGSKPLPANAGAPRRWQRRLYAQHEEARVSAVHRTARLSRHRIKLFIRRWRRFTPMRHRKGSALSADPFIRRLTKNKDLIPSPALREAAQIRLAFRRRCADAVTRLAAKPP